MYSMPYYTYGSTANFLFSGPTVLIYKLYQKIGAVTRINVVLEIKKLNELLDSYSDFSECQLNANGLWYCVGHACTASTDSEYGNDVGNTYIAVSDCGNVHFQHEISSPMVH